LSPQGKIEGDVYNSGEIALMYWRDNISKIEIDGNYFENEKGLITLLVHSSKAGPGIIIEGKASLAGRIKMITLPSFTLKDGAIYPLISANSITGKFSNPDDKVTSQDGTVFAINYGEKEVSLTVVGK